VIGHFSLGDQISSFREHVLVCVCIKYVFTALSGQTLRPACMTCSHVRLLDPDSAQQLHVVLLTLVPRGGQGSAELCRRRRAAARLCYVAGHVLGKGAPL
jgi:hypothetical protein